MSQGSEQVKERPIMFSTPMVRALLDGRKTQTRRIVKGSVSLICSHCGESYTVCDRGSAVAKPMSPCPFGVPGDLLWVRETWQVYCPLWNGAWCGHGTPEGVQSHEVYYKADGPESWKRGAPARWKSPIHMPRWESRLTLTITDVRVERVQDISEADAIAEGLSNKSGRDDYWDPWRSRTLCANQHDFMMLWNTIHGHGAWERNEWVFALTFTTEVRK